MARGARPGKGRWRWRARLALLALAASIPLLFTASRVAARPPAVDCAQVQCTAVLPGADLFVPVDGDPPVIQGFKKGFLGTKTPVGFVAYSPDVTPVKGFGGPIGLLIGIDKEGTITGIRILHHHETIFERRTLDPQLMVRFLQQLIGQKAGTHFALGYQANAVRLDGISLATVTSTGLMRTVEDVAYRVKAAYLGGGGSNPLLRPWWEPFLPFGSFLGLGLTLAGLVLGVVSFTTRRYRLIYGALVLAVVGFWLKKPLSVAHLLHLAAGRPQAVMGDGFALILLAAAVISSLLVGRLFCGRLCPFGLLQDLIYKLVPHRRWRLTIPEPVHRKLIWLKYGILVAAVATAALGHNLALAQVEPFDYLFVGIPSVLAGLYLVLLLLTSTAVERPFCRYLCPLGAALGILSVRPFFQVKRVPFCSKCQICRRDCPVGAIDNKGRVSSMECIRCDRCEVQLQAPNCPAQILAQKQPQRHWVAQMPHSQAGD